jgi:hypothetical protein
MGEFGLIYYYGEIISCTHMIVYKFARRTEPTISVVTAYFKIIGGSVSYRVV